MKAGVFVGLGAAVLVLAADLLLSSGARAASNPFDLVELKTYDRRMRQTATPATARPDIALVEIDDYSLRNLQPNAGRWPWPRAVHSMLIDYLSRAPAKVIAYDIDFAEADTRRGFDFGLGSVKPTVAPESKSSQVSASGGARGIGPDRNAKGGGNPAVVKVTVTAAEVETFKKGIV